jgi:glycosyltransferase involved in cell wall biosynthesis
MGGGVGNALSSLVVYEKANNPSYVHNIVMLDIPVNIHFVELCKKNEVAVSGLNEVDILLSISIADVVILHWWNHPAMASFLASFPRIKCRIILWSHVNGCNYPCLPFNFLKLMSYVIFTTPFSYENNLWTKKQQAEIKKFSKVVYGLGDYSKLISAKLEHNISVEKFNIGYVGTLSKSKIHPKFIEYCLDVINKVPNASFIMVGDNEGSKELQVEAQKQGILSRFEFTGYSNQITDELARFDVFAYPLNPHHFGTTENVLIEAMAYGIPVVALNHNTEKYIIGNDRRIGLLANSKFEYSDCIRQLYDDPILRKSLSDNARLYIETNYTFSKNIKNFLTTLDEVLNRPKRAINFLDGIGNTPHEWFMNFLGEEKSFFLKSTMEINSDTRLDCEKQIKTSSSILRERKKSSISHFSEYFPDNFFLKYWKSLINE